MYTPLYDFYFIIAPQTRPLKFLQVYAISKKIKVKILNIQGRSLSQPFAKQWNAKVFTQG